MCGKPNPDDLDVCQFCQGASSLIIPPPEKPLDEEASPPTDEERPPQEKAPDIPPSQPDWLQPDWLQSLRRGGGTEELGEQGEPEPEEPPDWAEDEGSEGAAQESESEGCSLLEKSRIQIG
jgi:hypothetical protein